MRPTRRQLLSAATAVTAALAGCNGDDAATPTTGAESTGVTGTAEAEATVTEASPTAAPSDGELDLREANVTGVEFTRVDDGIRFDVTLYHDDDGEDGYANWWQVERFDGARLGRRDLLHAHGTREFTRSETVTIGDDVDCVVVRGHDETHGYGGQAVLANLVSDATRTVRQGPEPRAFDEDDCP